MVCFQTSSFFISHGVKGYIPSKEEKLFFSKTCAYIHIIIRMLVLSYEQHMVRCLQTNFTIWFEKTLKMIFWLHFYIHL